MKFDKSPAWLVELFRALQPEVGGIQEWMRRAWEYVRALPPKKPRPTRRRRSA